MTDNRTTELRRCKHCGEKPQVLKRDGGAAHACRVLDRELRMTVDEWNAENEDATDVLRCMLDERGVRWIEATPSKTKWYSPVLNGPVAVSEWNGKLVLDAGYVNVTPEQAIAATLGGGKLTANDVLNAVYKHGARWQAIADELNELGSGTCELVETDSYSDANELIHVLECSECGKTCEHVNGSYPRCPHCGRKAVK